MNRGIAAVECRKTGQAGFLLLHGVRTEFGLCSNTLKSNLYVSGVLVLSVTNRRLILTFIPLVESSQRHPSDRFPAQFRLFRLIINKVMLVYFSDDFVTVLFCDVLTQSICFRSVNLIRSIDHLYQSNGDLILYYSRHFGVQNGSLQAEILLHVLDFELKQFTESITIITMGARNRLLLL